MSATLIFLMTGGLFVLGALSLLWHLRWVRRLPAFSELVERTRTNPNSDVRCSIVVAARDEQTRVEETIRRLPGTRGDALRSIEILPGVARTSIGQGTPILRGASWNVPNRRSQIRNTSP